MELILRIVIGTVCKAIYLMLRLVVAVVFGAATLVVNIIQKPYYFVKNMKVKKMMRKLEKIELDRKDQA